MQKIEIISLKVENFPKIVPRCVEIPKSLGTIYPKSKSSSGIICYGLYDIEAKGQALGPVGHSVQKVKNKN